MNILIVLDDEQGSKDFESRNAIILKYADLWNKNGNKVYLLGRAGVKQKYDFSYIQAPAVFSNNTLLSVWFKFVNPPKFDLIIEELSSKPFLHSSATKILYLNESLNNLFRLKSSFVKSILKYLTSHSAFLVTKDKYRQELKDLNVNEEKIYLISEGFRTVMRKTKSVVEKKLAVYAENREEIIEALDILRTVERKDEGWKYLFYSTEPKKVLDQLISGEEFDHKITFLSSSKGVFVKTIAKADILLNVSDSKSSFINILFALSKGVKVLAKMNNYINSSNNLEKFILTFRELKPQELGRLIISIPKNLQDSGKNAGKLKNLLDSFSWDNQALESLKFLESI